MNWNFWSRSTEPQAPQRRITAEELRRRMGEPGTVLLDVRTPAEYAQEHLPGSVLIPSHELARRAARELTDKSAPIVVYCRSGHRSAGAAKELVSQGYCNVFDFGGIHHWDGDIVRG